MDRAVAVAALVGLGGISGKYASSNDTVRRLPLDCLGDSVCWKIDIVLRTLSALHRTAVTAKCASFC